MVWLGEFLNEFRVPPVVTLPALGCGLGGLDWDRVSALMAQHLQAVDAQIYAYAPREGKRWTAE